MCRNADASRISQLKNKTSPDPRHPVTDRANPKAPQRLANGQPAPAWRVLMKTGRRRKAVPLPAPPDPSTSRTTSASPSKDETGRSRQFSTLPARIARFLNGPETAYPTRSRWQPRSITGSPPVPLLDRMAQTVPDTVPALASRSLARRSVLTEASFCCCSALRTASRSLSYRWRSPEIF